MDPAGGGHIHVPADTGDGASGWPEGITVSGNGTAKAKPTMIEVEAHVAGEAELASDAKVKYQDARKKDWLHWTR